MAGAWRARLNFKFKLNDGLKPEWNDVFLLIFVFLMRFSFRFKSKNLI